MACRVRMWQSEIEKAQSLRKAVCDLACRLACFCALNSGVVAPPVGGACGMVSAVSVIPRLVRLNVFNLAYQSRPAAGGPNGVVL